MDTDAILGFTAGLLAHRFDEPRPIPAFHMELWKLCESDYPQVAIAAPRGHAKSTALTFSWLLYRLMFKLSKHVLVISSNESLAADQLGEIRTELHDNDYLAEMFGPFTFKVEKEAELIVQFPDKQQFRLIAKGAGQRMRGLKWDRKRPDLVLCDDLEDDEIVLNEERREKFRRWFYGAVRPIVKTGGLIRLYGTIIHMDSLLERTMPRLTNAGVEENSLVMSSKVPTSGWMSVKYRAHNEDLTEILWPSAFPAERLRAIRKEFAEMGMLDVYGQEYLNDPIDDSTAIFRRQDMLKMTTVDYEARKVFYVGCDLAISEKKKAAYTTFVIGGVDEKGGLHVVDVRRGHWDALAILDEIYAINKRWQPALFRFEEENIAKTLLPVLNDSMVRRGFLPWDSKNPSKDKRSRATAFQYRVKAGNVHFDKEADWYADYEEELTHFPKWRTLDQVDASAWLGDILDEQIEAPTDKEVADDKYQELLETDFGLGANLVTGY
jgi:predicted phage terminase large subunit-like protein